MNYDDEDDSFDRYATVDVTNQNNEDQEVLSSDSEDDNNVLYFVVVLFIYISMSCCVYQ
jgi:hypothetical protein